MSNYLQDLNNDQRKAVEQTEGSKHGYLGAWIWKNSCSHLQNCTPSKHGTNPFNILASYLYKQSVKRDERKN